MTPASTVDTAAADQALDQFEQTPGGRQAAATSGAPAHLNVGSAERWFSTGLGACMAVWGLRRLGPVGLLTAAAGAMMIKRGVTGRCELYAALGVDTAKNQDGARPEDYFKRGIHVEETFTVMKPAGELYAFWRKLENLPRFMTHLRSVSQTGGDRSQWEAVGPMGMTVKWDAQIINDEPGELIAWRSVGGADVDNAGSVRFKEAPGGRGTEVAVTIDYIPPAGRVGSLVARLLGRDADQLVRDDLRHFKQLMEAGEIPTISGQPQGICSTCTGRYVP